MVVSKISRIDGLENRVAEHYDALNIAVQKRDYVLLSTMMGLLLGALAIFVFIETAQTSELWFKMFGWNGGIAFLASIAIALFAASGVIWLLRSLLMRLIEQAMKRLPPLPEWPKSESND